MRRTRLQGWIGALLAVAIALPSVSVAASGSDSSSSSKKKKKGKTAKEEKAEAAAPAPAAPSTKGLEAKLKKDEAAEEPTRLAPATITTALGAEVSKDAQAEAERDEAIKRIMRVLPKQKNPDVRAQLKFELAEHWWEKSKFVRMSQEVPALNKAADDWHKCMQTGTLKKCGFEPRLNTSTSDQYRKEAVELYQALIKEFPKYTRIDEVRFYLAYDTMELVAAMPTKTPKEKAAKEIAAKKGIDAYKDLIALAPKSKYVSDAYIELGNWYFDHNDLNRANAAFEDAVKQNKKHTMTYAIYKLAWVRYNQGQYGEPDEPKRGDCGSVCYLKQVVAREEKNAVKGQLNMKTEALRDLVLSFAKNGERDSAIKYYEQKAKTDSKVYVVRLANEFFSAGGAQYDDAIKTYQYLMTKYPVDCGAPEWQAHVVLSYDKKSNRQKVREEIQRLVDHYGDKSEWWQGCPNGHAAAIDLTEEALYNLVTDYHQEAIKTKSVATYKLARDIYKEYIDHFPNSERAYLMRYYYAEILYALEDYQKAFNQYKIVAEDKDKEHKQFLKPAAKDMLLAAEKLVDIQDGLYTIQLTEDSKALDEHKAKGDIQETHIKASVDKKAVEKPLTTLEKQLVGACDEYTKLVPNAEDEARVRLRAAILYFEHYMYVEAADHFGYIIGKWPEDPTSRSAAGLILEALESKEEWDRLNKRAREFQSNKKLLAGEKNADVFKKKLALYIENSSFKLAEKLKGDDEEQAEAYNAFLKEFPKSKYAPIAGYNAFLNYQNLKKLDLAIEIGDKILNDYPKADTDDMRRLPGQEDKPLRPELLPDLTFRLAKTYELVADFTKAAQLYERYVKEYPVDKVSENTKRTPDAQFNAALWYKGLGEDDKAIAAFQKYIDIYKKVPIAQRTEWKLVPDAQVVWTICQFYEDHKEWSKFLKESQKYLETYTNEPKWQHLNVKYRQFLAFKELSGAGDVPAAGKGAKGKKKAAEAPTGGNAKQMWDNAIVIKQDYDKLTPDDKKREAVKQAVAQTQFYLLEPEFQKFKDLKFRASDKGTMKADLKSMTDAMKDLQGKYTKVVGYGNGDWAIAALVRIAMMPRELAGDMRIAPIPHGFDADQKEMYKSTLEDTALGIEGPAVDLFLKAMSKAFELGIYNEWTLQAESALAEFKPELVGAIHKDLPLSGSTFFIASPDEKSAKPKAAKPAPKAADAKAAPKDAAAEAGGDE